MFANYKQGIKTEVKKIKPLYKIVCFNDAHIPFHDDKKQADSVLLEKYDDDYTNIIFLGRIVPNKKQQDVIAAFASYQKNYNPKSRLFLVGNPNDFEKYNEQTRRQIRIISIKVVNRKI